MSEGRRELPGQNVRTAGHTPGCEARAVDDKSEPAGGAVTQAREQSDLKQDLGVDTFEAMQGGEAN